MSWFDDHAPTATTNSVGDGDAPPDDGTDPFADAVVALYWKYYNRAPTPAEVQAHRGNPGGLAAVEAALKTASGGTPATPGASGGPQNGDYRTWFNQLVAGKPATSDTLKALEPELAKYGIKLQPANAKGIISKITLPTGEIVRVGNYFDSDPSEGLSMSWGWTGQGGGGGGSSSTSGVNQFGALLNDPHGMGFGNYGTYSSSPWSGGDYTAPVWTGGDFTDPTMDDVMKTPGYQVRLDAGRQARERSAAAQGTVLNPGTQKALERYGQDYATGEYQQARSNAFQNYQSRYGQFLDAANLGQQQYQNRYNAYLDENSRTLKDFLTNYDVRHTSDTDYWARLRDLYLGGEQAAVNSYHPPV